jgi:hypothetical protein
MWSKMKNIILAHIVQSIVISLIVVVGIGGASYYVIQKSHSSDSTKDSTLGGNTNSCIGLVKIGATAVEKDPAGDPEAWIRFDYTTTVNQAVNCKYTITFYDSREEAIRTIPNIENTFQSPDGQIHNGYSSTPYQEGMTARVIVQ